MTLANDYRPTTLKSFVGNEVLVKTLESILERNSELLPHSFLITGASGCGKTSLGRIIARRLGTLKNPIQVSPNDFDYKEMDAADFRGIDTVRYIRSTCNVSPLQSKYRIWLLDECHQLTNDAQEALLKALEHPPKHVIWILCTTNPEKLKVTLKRRCTVLNVESVNDQTMLDQLQKVLKLEEISIKDNVLNKIVSCSNGSMGIALQLLDKVLDLEKESEMLKAIAPIDSESIQIIDLCRALYAKKKWKDISAILREIKNEEPEKIRRAILGYHQSILLNKEDQRAFIIMAEFDYNTYDSGFAGIVLRCAVIYFGS